MSVQSQETPPQANQPRIEDRPEPLTNQQGQQSSFELRDGTQAITRDTFWLGAFTAVLALATVILAAYTIRLEYTTRDSAQRQLRAYVGVLNGSIRLVNLREGGQGLAVHIELENAGQTPAYDFTTWIKRPTIDDAAALPYGSATPIADRTGQSITSPGARANLDWTITVSETELQALRNGSKRIFIWGGCDFRDAFNKARYFAFRMTNGGELFDQVGEAWSLQPHKIGYSAN